MFKDKDKIIEYLNENPYVLAPMVDHSDFPFRMLTRKHNAGLCFTPMIHARLFVEDKIYRNRIFKTGPGDRPLVCQIAGDDPEILLKAAQLLEPTCDIIDLNFGCPQGIAKRGNYGSFLLENEELVCKIVKYLSERLKVPLACKIRLFKNRERSFELAKKLEESGCQLLTVHGRTKEQNKETMGSADWEAIKEIKRLVGIPVIANGNISAYGDLKKCLDSTNCDGVMSAEAVLEYPALFSKCNEIGLLDNDDLVAEYLDCCKMYVDQEHFMKSHLFKMLYSAFQVHHDLRDRLVGARCLEEFVKIAGEVKERRRNETPEDKIKWYWRWQKGMQGGNVGKQVEVKIEGQEVSLKKIKNE